jgi:hypothetical protein
MFGNLLNFVLNDSKNIKIDYFIAKNINSHLRFCLLLFDKQHCILKKDH